MNFRIREMTPFDLPQVEEKARQQNERDGTTYPVPEIFQPDLSTPGGWQLAENVPLALVSEINGRVEQAHVYLRTVEQMSFGTNRRATALSLRQAAAAFYLLKQKGYQDLHVLVPKQRTEAMKHRLAEAMGLERDDDRLAHFYREL